MLSRTCAVVLFAVAVLATVTISMPDPTWVWAAEGGVLLTAAVLSFRTEATHIFFIPIGMIAMWGFAQLASGATVYRCATLDAAVRLAACAAAAWVAACISLERRHRDLWLKWLCWFSVAVSLLAVLAYHTSPGKILWTFSSEYPDNWGPFASRNSFAQFLELSFPVAVYQLVKSKTEKRWMQALAPAILLASGIASASRAGAILLLIEAVVLVFLLRRRIGPAFAGVVLASAALIVMMGAGTLVGRLQQSDPLSMRREIFQSAWQMTASRPWTGYGLGTFVHVYPEFALFDPGSRIEHAHDDWLEWASEGGIPFAAVWLALAAMIAGPAVRSIWGLGVLATFAHALVDYPFAKFGVAIWFFALCGFLLSAARSKSTTAE